MSNPYATALRINRRDLDEIRIAVAEKTGVIDEITTAQNAIHEEVQRQIDLPQDMTLSFIDFGAYAMRKHSENAQLQSIRNAAEGELDVLMEQSEKAFGSYKAVSQAAGNWEDARAKNLARREQTFMDEIASRAGGYQ